MAYEFNTFFVNVGTNLAVKVLPSNKNFDLYLKHNSTIFAENSKAEEEFKNVFFQVIII